MDSPSPAPLLPPQALFEVASALSLPLLITDPQLRIGFCNTAFERCYSRLPGSLTGKTLADALPQFVGTELWAGIIAALNEPGQRTLEPAISTMMLETTLHSGPWGIAIMHSDAALKTQLEQLQWNYLDKMAHAFKTPLTVISGLAETVVNSGAANPALVLEFMDRIRGQSQFLSLLVDRLLFIARVEGFSPQVEGNLIELQVPVMQTCEHCLPMAEVKGLSFSLSCEPEPLVVQGNENALSEMILNLIDNAIKYSNFAGEVHVELRAVPGGAELSVSDDGIGIPPDELERVFEHFFRGDKARSGESPGTGMGLTMVQTVVKAHGGEVSVRSLAGEGTTFTVFLPTVEPDPDQLY
jgi:signal transduction histidine kinase